MFVFHFDFNTSHFKVSYLKKWLKKLKDSAYDTIIWELEDFVKFDTAKEVAAPDAISKKEFVELLNFSRSLGLKNIPLLQTLAHVEYVLRVPQYAELAEGDSGYLYCPHNPEVYKFLTRWLLEYKEIFYDAPFFHIGCDETLMLGESCRKCNSFIRNHGVAELLSEHICKIHDILQQFSIRSAVWADMIIRHPECVNILPKDLLLFEWRYNIYDGKKQLWCPGEGERTIQEFSTETKLKYHKFLFPQGETENSVPETFYLADYLKSFGFEVILCPSTSSYGGNIFCGEPQIRFYNTFDTMRKSHEFAGCAVTSWSVHLFPYELQEMAIAAANYHKNFKCAAMERKKYCDNYVFNHFKIHDSENFMKIFELLNVNSIFLSTNSAGHSKAFHSATLSSFLSILDSMSEQLIYKELKQTKKVLTCCFEALEIIESMLEASSSGINELKLWKLAIENMIARSRFVLTILHWQLKEQTNPQMIHDELKRLRTETDQMYREILTDFCRKRFIALLFDLPIEALKYLHAKLPQENQFRIK